MKKKEIVESLVGLVTLQHKHTATLLKSMAKHIPVKADRVTFFDELLVASQDIKAACKRLVDERRKEQVKADEANRGTFFEEYESLGASHDVIDGLAESPTTILDEAVKEDWEIVNSTRVDKLNKEIRTGALGRVVDVPKGQKEPLAVAADIISLALRQEFTASYTLLLEYTKHNLGSSIWSGMKKKLPALDHMCFSLIDLARFSPYGVQEKTDKYIAQTLERAAEAAKQLSALGIVIPEYKAESITSAVAEVAEPDTKPTGNSAWVDAINNACKDPKMMDRLIEGASMAADLQKRGIQTGGAFLVAHAVSSGQAESNTNDLPADAQVPKAIGPSAAVIGITKIVEATLRGEYEEAYALVMELPGMRDIGKGKQEACKEYPKFDKLSFALRSRESQKDDAKEVARVTSIIKETATELAAELADKGVAKLGYTAKSPVANPMPKPGSVVWRDEYLDKSLWVVDEYRLKPITAVLGSCWLDGSRKKGELSDRGKVFLRLEGVPPVAVAELTDGEVYHMGIVEEELKKLGK